MCVLFDGKQNTNLKFNQVLPISKYSHFIYSPPVEKGFSPSSIAGSDFSSGV